MLKFLMFAVVITVGAWHFGFIDGPGETLTEKLPESIQQYSPFDVVEPIVEAVPSLPIGPGSLQQIQQEIAQQEQAQQDTENDAENDAENDVVTESEEVDEVLEWNVVSVQDGDSLTIEAELGIHVRLRLAGIDAPESAQTGGDRAGTYLRLCAGDDVAFVVVDEDQYGRLVSYVYGHPDAAQSCNLQLVREGLAYAYLTDDPDILSAEASARESGIGVWADPDAIRPSDWRKANPRQ